MKIKIYYLSYVLVFFIISCNKTDEETTPTVDFSKYIAVGNSLTAGVSNNGLYNSSLQNSYPNLLATQLKAAGGGTFTQAMFATGQENGTGYLKLTGYNQLLPIIETVGTSTAIRSTNPPRLTKYIGENNNLGIPFIKMSEVDSPDLVNNVFFERLLPEGNPSTTYLQMLSKTNPTFFTFWLGNNDLLAYANSGGTRDFTTKSMFQTNLKKLLDVLTKNGAKGVVANLSDITAAPTISLISNYRPLFTQSKFYIQTSTGVREGTSQDLLLPSESINSLNVNDLAKKGTTIQDPWANNEVLDSAERNILLAATKEYNAILEAEAKARNLAYLDTFGFMEKLKNTIDNSGDLVNTAYLTGGFFSLDGAHLTPKGYAFTANEYIKIINSYYKTNIALLDTKKYAAVVVEK